MYRYTTPTIGIVFPNSVTPSEIVEFWVTVTQKEKIVLNKTKSEFSQDQSNPQRFYTVLSEEETAKLNDKLDAKVQVRANINGTSVASNIQIVDIQAVLKEGEILP